MTASAPPDIAKQYFGGCWDGSEVEAWRVDIGDHYWLSMSSRRYIYGYGYFLETQKNWISAYIDMPLATSDAADFKKLWFNDLSIQDMKRDWLRCALRHVQTTMKTSMKIDNETGNPRDEQHSAYLLDADVLLTADANYCRALAEIRRQAPFNFAKSRCIKPDKSTSIVEIIREALP